MSKLAEILRTLLIPLVHSINKKADKTEIPLLIPFIPSKLSELTDDSSHRTVTDDEKNAWDNKSEFSGNYSDLNDAPQLAAAALSGDYNDLLNIPAQKIVTDTSYIMRPANGDYAAAYDEYATACVSFEFRREPMYGQTVYLTTEYAYAKGYVYVSDLEEYVYWGNGSLHSSDLEDSGEEWCVCVVARYDLAGHSDHFVTYHTSETPNTLGVSTRTIEYIPLENELIPDTIQRVGDAVIIPSSTEGSTKRFSITVDDSGTLSAVEVVE